MTDVSRIIVGDALTVLRGQPDNYFHCCVTSPPYWGLREYGGPPLAWGGDQGCAHQWGETGISARRHRNGEAKGLHEGRKTNKLIGNTMIAAITGQFCLACGAWRGSLGLEPTPDIYVTHLVEIFREVRRVLRDDGTLWLNIGDSYAGSGKGGNLDAGKQATNHGSQAVGVLHGTGQTARDAAVTNATRLTFPERGIKAKDLVGIPWMLAFALRADGWYLRYDIIWHKPNCMPESVRDRPTNAHEHLFLLSKSARYFYNAEAIAEAVAESQVGRIRSDPVGGASHVERGQHSPGAVYQNGNGTEHETRNARNVWTFPTSPFHGAHFATFPPELATRCIMAGTSSHGCCGACGAPWEGLVERTDEIATSAKGSRFDRGKTLARDGGERTQRGERFRTRDAGWAASCHCQDASIEPCAVLDPFAGAGTTGLAAINLGRRFVGVEINPQYAELAKSRMPMYMETELFT